MKKYENNNTGKNTSKNTDIYCTPRIEEDHLIKNSDIHNYLNTEIPSTPSIEDHLKKNSDINNYTNTDTTITPSIVDHMEKNTGKNYPNNTNITSTRVINEKDMEKYAAGNSSKYCEVSSSLVIPKSSHSVPMVSFNDKEKSNLHGILLQDNGNRSYVSNITKEKSKVLLRNNITGKLAQRKILQNSMIESKLRHNPPSTSE